MCWKLLIIWEKVKTTSNYLTHMYLMTKKTYLQVLFKPKKLDNICKEPIIRKARSLWTTNKLKKSQIWWLKWLAKAEVKMILTINCAWLAVRKFFSRWGRKKTKSMKLQSLIKKNNRLRRKYYWVPRDIVNNQIYRDGIILSHLAQLLKMESG
jgi:hypothetical protein